jgi:hypothetical protein
MLEVCEQYRYASAGAGMLEVCEQYRYVSAAMVCLMKCLSMLWKLTAAPAAVCSRVLL